jgi:hypothetical protein
MIEQSKEYFLDIKDFYNPGIPRDIYNELSKFNTEKNKYRRR